MTCEAAKRLVPRNAPETDPNKPPAKTATIQAGQAPVANPRDYEDFGGAVYPSDEYPDAGRTGD